MNRTAFLAMRNKLDSAIRQAVASGIAYVYNKKGFLVGVIEYVRGQVSPFRFVCADGSDKSALFLASLKA